MEVIKYQYAKNPTRNVFTAHECHNLSPDTEFNFDTQW